MGNQQSGSGGEGGKKNDKGEKKKYEPPVPTRVGKKRKKTKGPDTASKLPLVTPHTKCKLRLLKQERIKDYLLMEEEFIRVCIFKRISITYICISHKTPKIFVKYNLYFTNDQKYL